MGLNCLLVPTNMTQLNFVVVSRQIHVDAHADSALPDIIDGMPLFDWPSDVAQVATLLQKNDVFILVSCGRCYCFCCCL